LLLIIAALPPTQSSATVNLLLEPLTLRLEHLP
jgi:hypothetical protein